MINEQQSITANYPASQVSVLRCQEISKLKSNSIGAYDITTSATPQNLRIASNFHHFILHLCVKQLQLWNKTQLL